jgi:hypothetical protein
MAPGDKKRASSPILSIAFTVQIIITLNAKATASKVFKPEPFYSSRQKFKIYYTQIRLGVWANNKRSIDKRLIRYTNEQIL